MPDKIKTLDEYAECPNKKAIKPVICVLGANGQLGQEFISYLSKIEYKNFVGFDSSLDISKKNHIKKLKAVPCGDDEIRRYPDVIINCAAYNNVYGSEEEKEICFKANALGPKYLAEFCKRRRIKLVHFSTNYVFADSRITMQKNKYIEFDKTNPFLFYGFSKLCGENFIKECIPDNSIVIRTSWLYSKFGKIRKLIEDNDIVNVANAVGNPTYTLDLVKQTLFLLEHKVNGLYHCANIGSTFKEEYIKKIIELLKLNKKTKLNGMGPSMPLENFMLNMEGLNIMRPWQDALEDCFGEI